MDKFLLVTRERLVIAVVVVRLDHEEGNLARLVGRVLAVCFGRCTSVIRQGCRRGTDRRRVLAVDRERVLVLLCSAGAQFALVVAVAVVVVILLPSPATMTARPRRMR